MNDGVQISPIMMHAYESISRRSNIVFDLDNTLADIEHRLRMIKEDPVDWERFYRAADDDPPIMPGLMILQSILMCGHAVEIWTARRRDPQPTNIVWHSLTHWLSRHVKMPVQYELRYGSGFFVTQPTVPPLGRSVPLVGVRMRAHDDHRLDTDLKGEWLQQSRKAHQPPGLIFEDCTRVVSMYRKAGIPCFQVADNNY